MRSPRRTARTASALMIGVALISAAALFTSSVRDTFGRILDRAVTADFIVIDPSFLAVPAEVGASSIARRSTTSQAVSPVRPVLATGRRTTRSACSAIDPAGVPRPRRPRRDRGRLRRRSPTTTGVMLFRRQGRRPRRRRRRHGRHHVLERRRARRSPSPASSTTTRSAATGTSRPTCSTQVSDQPPRDQLVLARADGRRRPRPGARRQIEAGGRRVPAGRGADQRRVPRTTRRARSTSCSS